MARPRKVNVQDLINGVDDYIASTDIPIVAEYANKNGITKQRLYQLIDEEKAKGNNELFDSIKKIIDTKEIALEKGGLLGTLNSSVVIFSLKQLGWKDKIEQTVKVNDKQEAIKELQELFNDTDGTEDTTTN